MEKSVKIEISHRTIIFTFLFFFFLRFLWLIKDLIFSIVIAFIIMSALKPAVNFLVKIKLPRIAASILVFFLFLAFFIYLIVFFIPPFVKEVIQLILVVPRVFESFIPNLGEIINFNSFTQYLPNITNQTLNIIGEIFSNTIFIFSTLFFSFYFLLQENLIKTILNRFFNEKRTKKITTLLINIEKKLSNWFWGELTLMLVVGIFSYIGFSLIGLNYALPLAVFAGLLEIIPNLGPTVAAVPAIVIGFSQSLFLGLAAFSVSFLVQQLENNLIVPLIMKKATGFNPIVVMITLIIGGRLGGVLGVLLALPILIILEEIFQTAIKSNV